MSALPPKADMCGALAHVCFVQERTHAVQQKETLFDHLVCASKERRGNFDTQAFCRF
jgi:hypothetical protein